MGALRIGGTVRVPGLDGRWSIWSAAADAPGAYFVTPIDDEARAVGAKFAVIRAIQRRDEGTPNLTLLRTDPHIPGLAEPTSSKKRTTKR